MKISDVTLSESIGLEEGIRYSPGVGFVVWTGQRWQWDHEDGLIAGSKISAWLDNHGMTASFDTVRRIRFAAKCADAIRVPHQEWDANPDLFGWGNGVWNLRTMENLGFDPSLKVTRHSTFSPEEGSLIQYATHIDELCGGGRDWFAMLRDLAGYLMTGHTFLQRFYVIESEGGRGKSTWAQIIMRILGEDHAQIAPAGLITKEEGYLNRDYATADVHGKRVLFQDEMDRGTLLNEKLVKSVASGLPLKGRHPGGTPFQFTSVAKLVLLTNHPVRFTSLGKDMERRLVLIRPSYSGEFPAPDLGRAERILGEEGNAIAYHLTLQAHCFLAASRDRQRYLPQCAIEAREDIFRENDRERRWLEERTEKCSGYLQVSDAFCDYRSWCDGNGCKPLGQIAFTKELKRLGSDHFRCNGLTGFRGLALRDE